MYVSKLEYYERYNNKEYNTTTFYVQAPKELLKRFLPNEDYHDATLAEFSIEFPTNEIEFCNMSVMLGPVAETEKSSSVYDWTDITYTMPYHEKEQLFDWLMKEDDIRNKISSMIIEAYKNKDHQTTWWHTLDVKDGKHWAIVVAWMDYNDNNDWRLWAKVAYQPTNSMMQEYDVDWIMPYDDNGMWTDELQVSESSALSNTGWLLKEWKYIRERID